MLPSPQTPSIHDRSGSKIDIDPCHRCHDQSCFLQHLYFFLHPPKQHAPVSRHFMSHVELGTSIISLLVLEGKSPHFGPTNAEVQDSTVEMLRLQSKISSFRAKIIQKLRIPCHVDICIFHCLIQQIFGNLNHHCLREERYLSNLQLLVLQRLS